MRPTFLYTKAAGRWVIGWSLAVFIFFGFNSIGYGNEIGSLGRTEQPVRTKSIFLSTDQNGDLSKAHPKDDRNYEGDPSITSCYYALDACDVKPGLGRLKSEDNERDSRKLFAEKQIDFRIPLEPPEPKRNFARYQAPTAEKEVKIIIPIMPPEPKRDFAKYQAPDKRMAGEAQERIQQAFADKLEGLLTGQGKYFKRLATLMEDNSLEDSRQAFADRLEDKLRRMLTARK